MYKAYGKRVMDILVSLSVLLLFMPLTLLVILLLAFANKGRIFFYQKRPGKGGKIFTIFKFKTMNDNTDANGCLLPDAERISVIGRIVRKLSIDEIPQLINVLTGDMSLVGPRPLLVEYLPLYTQRQAKRHDVVPGITGWAQVNGRNAISWQQKFEYDIWYVENVSFKVDLLILMMTISKVFKKEGINASSSSISMEKFKGNGV